MKRVIINNNDVTKYITSKIPIKRYSEGKYLWSFWFDSVDFEILDINIGFELETNQRVEIYYQGQLRSLGYIEAINETKEEEIKKITIKGFDKLFCNTRVGVDKPIELNDVKISKVLSEVSKNAIDNISDKYDLFGIEINITNNDNVDFIDYKSYEIEWVGELPKTNLNTANLTDIKTGLFKEASITKNDIKDKWNKDTLINAVASGDIYRGLLGYDINTGQLEYEFHKITADATVDARAFVGENDNKVKKWYNEDEEQFVNVVKVEGKYFLQYTENQLAYNTIMKENVNTNWSSIKSEMESMIESTGDSLKKSEVTNIGELKQYDKEEKTIVSMCILSSNTYEYDTAGGSETESKYEIYVFTLKQEDKIGCYYSNARVGRILKDIMKVSDNAIYITPKGNLMLDDRTGIGTIKVDKTGIVKMQEEVKEVETQENSITLPATTQGADRNGIFLLHSQPYDIEADILEHYSSLLTQKNKNTSIELMYYTKITENGDNKRLYQADRYQGKKFYLEEEYIGIINNVNIKNETIEFEMRKRI